MTKSEFDDSFLQEDTCVLHASDLEWAIICDYAATLGVKPQAILPHGEHDCSAFPYAYVNRIKSRMTARSNRDSFLNVLSFAEFLEAVSNDSVECDITDLNDIL